jgi:MFS family permease
MIPGNFPSGTLVPLPDEELPSAATLGGLQLNVSGIIGPALGGVLLYFLGANWVFGLNALCFIVVILALLQWKGNHVRNNRGPRRGVERKTDAD